MLGNFFFTFKMSFDNIKNLNVWPTAFATVQHELDPAVNYNSKVVYQFSGALYVGKLFYFSFF